MYYLFVGLLILIADQVSKLLVMNNLQEGESVSVLGSFLKVTYVQNKGAAFGFFEGKTILLSAIALLCILFVLTQWKKIMDKSGFVRWGVVVAVVGALGNMIDRLRFHAVIDFIDVIIFPPIFNLADIAIVFGVGLLFWEVLINDGKKAKVN